MLKYSLVFNHDYKPSSVGDVTIIVWISETTSHLLSLHSTDDQDQMSSTSNSHKPRKKKKTLAELQRTDAIAGIVSVDEHGGAVKPAFPLVAFLWPARGTTSQWVLIPLILMIVGLFRWIVGLWGYSGTHPDRSSMSLTYDVKVLRSHQCMVISRLRDTGWRLPAIYLYPCGISMISNTGASTTRPSPLTIAGSWAGCERRLPISSL